MRLKNKKLNNQYHCLANQKSYFMVHNLHIIDLLMDYIELIMGLKTKHSLNLRIKLKAIWGKNLKSYGVDYPENTAHEPGLLALYEVMPKPLSQEELTEFYETHSDTAYNMQLRHLASKGWDIRSGNSRFQQGLQDKNLKRDQLCLAQINLPHSPWLNSHRLKRTGSISNADWSKKLELYKDHGCAVCGQVYENYDQGHLDPNLGYSNENIVPMCSPCNNWAQDKVVFKLYKCYACNCEVIARPISIRSKEK